MNPESTAISSVIEKTDISLLREVKDSLELADQVRDALERYKKETGQRGRAIDIKYTYPKKYTAQRDFFEQYCKAKSALSTEIEKVYTPETLAQKDWTVIKSAINKRIRMHDVQSKPDESAKVPRQSILNKLWNGLHGIFRRKSSPAAPAVSVQPDFVAAPVSKLEDKESESSSDLSLQNNFVYCLDKDGNIQNPVPLKIVRIESGPDGRKYAIFEGVNTGWPLEQIELVKFSEPAAESVIPEIPPIVSQPETTTKEDKESEVKKEPVYISFSGDYAELKDILLKTDGSNKTLVSSAEELIAFAKTLPLPGGMKLESLGPQWIDDETFMLNGSVGGVNFSVTVEADKNSGKVRVTNTSTKAGWKSKLIEGTVKDRIGKIDQSLIDDIDRSLAAIGWKAQDVRIMNRKFMINLLKG